VTTADLEAVTAGAEIFLQVTFLVGVLYLVVATLQLGFLANFLSHSVISGFTTGASLIIGLSQMKYFLGISISTTHTAIENFIELVKHADESKWREVVMCSVWLSLLLVIKKVAKKYPKVGWLRPLGPITVCVLSIIVVVIGDLDGKQLVKAVGNVPQGMVFLREPENTRALPVFYFRSDQEAFA
jgi:sulfate transporter 4